MPRRRRLKLAAVPLHIVQRGNNRSACCFAEEDYRFYLDHLGQACRKHGVDVHAHVLMANHVHLLLTPETGDGPSQVMKQLAQRYVQYVNCSYRRSGTRWQGRFRSGLVGEENDVLGCQRYSKMNPTSGDDQTPRRVALVELWP